MTFTRLYYHWLCLLFLCVAPMNGQAAKKVTTKQLNNLTVLQAIDLEEISTNQKPTLIKLWASWCPQCLSELEYTQKLAVDETLKGINIASLASPGFLNEMPSQEFTHWFSGLNFPELPVLLDTEGWWVNKLGVRAYPSWVLLNEQGEFVRLIPGSLNKEQILALSKDPQAVLHKASNAKEPTLASNETTQHEVYFAGGCFWGVEAYFQQLPGVISAISGYANGHKENPTYQQVVYTDTGHAETVQVRYHPSQITFDDIIWHFLLINDTTTLNRQRSEE